MNKKRKQKGEEIFKQIKEGRAEISLDEAAEALGREPMRAVDLMKEGLDLLGGVTVVDETSPEEWNRLWKEDGRPTPKRCPKCGRVWPEMANFCGFCGVKVEIAENKIQGGRET